jgi:predicted nucleic acid-binding protein
VSVLVDTTIWSFAFRRRFAARNAREQALVDALEAVVHAGEALLLGLVRQEILSGIRDELSFLRIREELRDYPDVPVLLADYETAAAYYSRCRRAGVTPSVPDMLICAVANRLGASVFSADLDFSRYAHLLPVTLLTPSAPADA